MTTRIEVSAPMEVVFNLFLDKTRFKEWKTGFVSYEAVSGVPGSEGAVTRLNYKRYTMIETIQTVDKPHQYTAVYEHQQNNSTMLVHKAVNKFTALGADKTLIMVEADIVKVNNFFMKIMVKLMAGAGEKQSREQLALFKIMAEKA